MIKTLLIILFLNMTIAYNAIADTGCLVSSNIYTYSFGNIAYGNPPGSPGTGWYPSYWNNASYRYSTAGVYCVVGSSSPCQLTNGTWGTLVTFSLVQCPLDDYIWLLILPLGVFATNMLRKRNLNLFTEPALLA